VRQRQVAAFGATGCACDADGGDRGQRRDDHSGSGHCIHPFIRKETRPAYSANRKHMHGMGNQIGNAVEHGPVPNKRVNR
jgi:hypothetical protein